MSISPNVPSPQESYHYEGTTGTPRWIAVVFIVLFLALVGLGYAGYSVQSRLDSSLNKAQEQKMHMTQAELANARSRSEAFRKDQQAADQKLADQLTSATRESTEKINAVATEVGGARKDIDATRSDLEATKGRLERASGDMGVMSGLIAHNRDDLEELKRRGDRNYYEFKITKSKTAQKVGPVQVTLNKTDLKKSKYTVTVFVDDRSIEKKDKTAGEPVQFYVRGASRMPPYEFVVFEVGKNQITGYLSTPKDSGATPAAAAKPS